MGIFFFIFLKNRKRQLPKSIKKFLVIRSGSIGDVLLITPLLQALSASYPNAHITALIPPQAKDVLVDNPHISSIITSDILWRRGTSNFFKLMLLGFQLQKEQFDLGFDTRGDIRNMFILYFSKTAYRVSFGNISGGDFLLHTVVSYKKKHEIDANLDLLRTLGIEVKNRKMVFMFDESDISFINEFLLKKEIKMNKPIIGFNPSSSWKYKDWPLEKFTQLGDILISEYGAQIIILGKGEKDIQTAKHIYHRMNNKPILAVNDLNLKQTVALIDQLEVLVCNSSALAHLAALTSTTTIVLFGSDDPMLWLHEEQIGLKKNADCSPCRQRKCKRAGQNDQCMNLISVEEVIHVIEEVMREKKYVNNKPIR